MPKQPTELILPAGESQVIGLNNYILNVTVFEDGSEFETATSPVLGPDVKLEVFRDPDVQDPVFAPQPDVGDPFSRRVLRTMYHDVLQRLGHQTSAFDSLID